MLRYLFLLIIFFTINLKAQVQNPLDSIPQEKRVYLIKFGDLFAVEALADTTMKSFRTYFDSLQKNTEPNLYRLIDLKTSSMKKIPIEIINSLHKKEFSFYILSLYSKILTLKDFQILDSIGKTANGKETMAQLKKIYEGKVNPNDLYGSIFSDNKTHEFFQSIHDRSTFIYNNVLEALFLYIDEKTAAFKLKNK
jgi:hypothetical protein